MSCQVSFHPELPIVECIFSDRVGPDEIYSGIRNTVVLGINSRINLDEKSNILIDCKNAEGSCSITDIYCVLESLSQYQANSLRRLKQAMILPSRPNTAFPIDFWETLCKNRAFNVCCFSERVPALYWLLKDQNNSALKPA